jgi:ligand-binding sensor domain-containing protein
MKYFFFILFTFLSISANAQMPNWKIQSLNLNHEISNITMDSLGFIWLTADANLYRYDGKELELKLSIEDEIFTSVYKKNGLLFLGTTYGRILEFNPYVNSYNVIYTRSDYKPITGLYVIDEKQIITLSYGMGIEFLLNTKQYTFDITNGLLSNEVYEVVEYTDKYYISTDQGIQVINIHDDSVSLSEIKVEDGLSDLVTTQLFATKDKIWYSDYDSHIGKVDSGGNITNYKLNQKSKIKDILFHHGILYVLNEKGLQSFDNEKWKTKYENVNGSGSKFILIDEEDNLWIADKNNNLVVGNLKFQKFSFDIKNIRALTILDDRLFIGNEDGLYMYENDEVTQINSFNISYLTSYNDYLLVGTFSRGVMAYDQKNKLVDEIDNWSNIPNESILSIYVSNEDIFVSSLSGVMKMRLESGKLNPIQSLNSVVGQAYIYCMLRNNDIMYFGTDRNGLILWNTIKDDIQKIDRFRSGEKIGSVYSTALDSNSNLWFTSSEKGIGKMNRNGAEYLHQINNIKNEFTSITNLNDGSILLIRNSSVGLLRPEDNHFMYFDSELGLKEETPFLNTTTQNKINTYFVNDNNVYIYTPKSEVKIHPEIIIDEIKVNLSPIHNQSEFNEDENNITFSYKGCWLSDPGKLSYQYKLDGLGQEWRDTKDDQISFPKLRPGQYNFIVRAAENGIFSDEPETNFQFTIQKYWYNHWWIRFLLIGSIGFIIFRWWKINENQKKEKLKLEKTILDSQLINLKNQLNPHFLFNAFNTLVGLIEEDSDRSISFLERLTSYYRDMLELGKNGMVDLEREIQMLEQYIAILNERFSGQLNIEEDYKNPLGYLIPPMTLQLLIENAVKHNKICSKNPLLIRISQDGDTVSVWNQKSKLVSNSEGTKTGLSNIKKRFELTGLKAPLIKDSETYFEVIIKLKMI